MRSLIAIIAIIALAGCKQETAPGHSNVAPQLPADTLLKTEGCSVLKTNGVLKVKCADGSTAEAGAPSYHIRDGSGADLDDLMFLQTFGGASVAVVNKKSGNVLSYDTVGNVATVIQTLYTTNNCTGTIYAFPTSLIVKNRVLANNGAGPANVEAYRVIGFSAPIVNFLSKIQNGVCSTFTGAAAGASIVEATVFDDSDPLAIYMPIEIVLTN
jgi:hypothetical protein